MLEGYELLFYFGSAIYILAQCIICVGCFILVSKYKSIGSFMMLGGSIASIGTFILDKILLVYASAIDISSVMVVQGASNIIGNLAHLIFAVGIVVLAYQTIFSKKQTA